MHAGGGTDHIDFAVFCRSRRISPTQVAKSFIRARHDQDGLEARVIDEIKGRTKNICCISICKVISIVACVVTATSRYQSLSSYHVQ